MKTLEQRKEVEQAYKDGYIIHFKPITIHKLLPGGFTPVGKPSWDWDIYDYDYAEKNDPKRLVFESGINYTKNIEDAGKHYRYIYKNIELDPFRIANIYGIADPVQFTVLKKVLVPGARGKKDLVQDWKDILNAAERKLEMLEEDKTLT